ncbi:MAG: hypothetical protein JJT96_08855 [Opitutales bacterium]|nr:hypothetical protein [Opitutales bacterium]
MLIQVDVSNPEAVVFTATGNAPLVLNEATRLFQGVILQDFFPAGSNQGEGFTEEVFATNSALGPTNDSGDFIPYDIALITPGSPDLEIAHAGRFGGAYQIFDPASAAFSGSLILDLSDYMLPSAGAIGPISTDSFLAEDFSFGEPDIIGQWQVIPEPRFYGALFGLISLAWVVSRRRRQSGHICG